MSAVRPVEIERVLHVPGELLRSRDLSARLRADTELMWWHQRAVHDAVGVIAGLTVTVQPTGKVACVSPGLAYDARGRDVVLRENATIALPKDPTRALVLVLRRCVDGASRLTWVRPDRIERCDGVPLARWIPGQDGVLQLWPGRSRPLARPRVAFGATLPGSTAWVRWYGPKRRFFGLETRVETSSAGFTGRPCYFAWLQWPDVGSQDPRIAAWSFGLQHLAAETADGFTFRVVVRGARTITGERTLLTGERTLLLAYPGTAPLAVAWIGVEDELDRGSGA